MVEIFFWSSYQVKLIFATLWASKIGQIPQVLDLLRRLWQRDGLKFDPDTQLHRGSAKNDSFFGLSRSFLKHFIFQYVYLIYFFKDVFFFKLMEFKFNPKTSPKHFSLLFFKKNDGVTTYFRTIFSICFTQKSYPKHSWSTSIFLQIFQPRGGAEGGLGVRHGRRGMENDGSCMLRHRGC